MRKPDDACKVVAMTIRRTTPMRVVLAMLLLASPWTASANQSPASAPASAVDKFYAWVLSPKYIQSDRYVATDRALAPVRDLIGDELYAALKDRDAYEKTCTDLVPADIKGHMLDQNVFFLAPDVVHSLVSTQAVIHGDVAHVSARLENGDDPWTDTVVLIRNKGRWVIVDIRWQQGQSLTRRLVDFARHRCSSDR